MQGLAAPVAADPGRHLGAAGLVGGANWWVRSKMPRHDQPADPAQQFGQMAVPPIRSAGPSALGDRAEGPEWIICAP
jgi:hypothetical protein